MRCLLVLLVALPIDLLVGLASVVPLHRETILGWFKGPKPSRVG